MCAPLLLSTHAPDPIITYDKGVADEHWIFAARFKLEHFEEVMHGVRRAEIVFDGLDTFCTIYLVCIQSYRYTCLIVRVEWQDGASNRQHVRHF